MLGAVALLGYGACGATGASPARTRAATATGAVATSSATVAPSVCAATVAETLSGIAGRIYHEAATGGNVAQAVHRVQSSGALAAAIRAGSTGAADTALRSLLLGQIVRVEVLRGGRAFATAGSGQALAPVSGSIPGTGASFVLSVQSDHSFLQVTSQLTGAQVLLLAGPRRVAGTLAVPPGSIPAGGPVSIAGQSYQVSSLPARPTLRAR